jgi:hypothetical protein
MAHTPEVTNMALFCDFENIALGVQDAKYEKFDIGKVLERLLLKGQHRREEGVLRLGALQVVQGADARSLVRADRDSARAAIGQELGRHPDGRRRARPVLHESRTSRPS